MNRDWQFFKPGESSVSELLPPPDGAWEPAALPHTVRLEPRDVSGGRNYQGVCWYKKSFPAQPEWKGRIVYLKFQGAMQVADVWLNDVHLTTHYGGYLPFTIDISKARFDSRARTRWWSDSITPTTRRFLRASRKLNLTSVTSAACIEASILKCLIPCTSPIRFWLTRLRGVESLSPIRRLAAADPRCRCRPKWPMSRTSAGCASLRRN